MGLLTSLASLKYLFSGSSSSAVPSAVPTYVRETDRFGAWASSTRLGHYLGSFGDWIVAFVSDASWGIWIMWLCVFLVVCLADYLVRETYADTTTHLVVRWTLIVVSVCFAVDSGIMIGWLLMPY